MNDNQEFHDLIDTLTDQKFSGEITLYMHGGFIETCRKSERVSKKGLEKAQARKKRVLTPVRTERKKESE
jgi:hypothetical protein